LLLRNPAAKEDVWEGMKLLMREMGLPWPGGEGVTIPDLALSSGLGHA
jgi:hypothetical protein